MGSNTDNKIISKQDSYLQKLFSSQNVQRVSLRKKEIYLLPIGQDNYVWLIISGWILPVRSDSEGRIKGTQLLGPGDIFGISGFADNTKSAPVYPLNSVILLRVPTIGFENMMKKDTELSQYVLKYVCQRYHGMLDELERATLWSLDERIQYFTEKIEHNNVSASETLVAWAVGAHPASVCRALKQKIV